MWRGWSVLAITAVAVIALQKAHAANTSNNSAEYRGVGEPSTNSIFQEIQIVFAFVNSRIPTAPSSRPKPERFTPPNGRRGSEATIALMKTIPVRSEEHTSELQSRVE